MIRSHARFAWLLALVAVSAVRPRSARAEDVVDPVDALEDKALQLEGRARFDEARRVFEQAFATAVDQANRAGGEKDRERNWALAEALLEKIDSTTEASTKQADTEKFLDGLDPLRLGPVLGGDVEWFRARLRYEKGDLDAAKKLTGGPPRA